jgi:Homeodomain-like domain
MMKKDTQHHGRLTGLEKDEIVRLAKLGLSVTAIAKQMSLTPQTVARWKRANGLPSWPALPEAKIVELLRDGLAPRTIAQTLRTSYRGTRRFAHAHGFGRPRKVLSKAQLEQLKTEILAREGSAAALSKKHRCSYKTVLSLAHSLLRCERFLPSWKNPLASYLPQKWAVTFAANKPSSMGAADLFVKLVNSVINKSFDGRFPYPQKHDENFAAALLYCFRQRVPGFRAQPQPVLDHFYGGLTEAIATLRQSQNAKWEN